MTKLSPGATYRLRHHLEVPIGGWLGFNTPDSPRWADKIRVDGSLVQATWDLLWRFDDKRFNVIWQVWPRWEVWPAGMIFQAIKPSHAAQAVGLFPVAIQVESGLFVTPTDTNVDYITANSDDWLPLTESIEPFTTPALTLIVRERRHLEVTP